VTAVHSFVIGGGVSICGASDVIIASEDAYFSLPEMTAAPWEALASLAHVSAAQGARGLLYGRRIDAAEAYRLERSRDWFRPRVC